MGKATIPSFEATVRTESGSKASKRLRKQGLLPAVLYGHKQENVSLSVRHDEVMHELAQGVHIVELNIDGRKERALIKSVQHEVLGNGIEHVDFSRVALDEKVHVPVSLDFHGEPAGAVHGGVVEYHLTEVEVEALPMDIPETLRVEIAHLEVGDMLHASDLIVPDGVKLLIDPDEIIVGVHTRRVAAVEEVEVEGEEIAEPEVIGEKKEEETEEES